MQVGMIGLGRMGANMVRRLMRGGHRCVVHGASKEGVQLLGVEGALGSVSLDDFVTRLAMPRIVWLMVPAAIVDATLDDLSPRLAAGDVVVDGGNSYYRDDIEAAKRLATGGLHYVDCGTSGGVWGLERGYCLMIGGDPDVVRRLDPLFATLAPGAGSVAPSPGREQRAGTAEQGYLHCGPNGAGHFVKMVHNGIEYGLMAAYAEGLNILRHANVGQRARAADAETTPLRNPEYYRYDFDLAEIAEVWRRGSVIASWLLDLTAAARAPLRRAHLRRRDRRSRRQADLPRAARHGSPRPPRGSRRRGGAGRLDARAPQGARPREHRASRRRRRRGRLRRAGAPAPLRRGRLRRGLDLRRPPPGAGRQRAAAPLPRHPAESLPHRGRGARALELRARRARRPGEAVRARPA